MVKGRNATGLKKHYSLDPPGRLIQSLPVTEAGKGEVSPPKQGPTTTKMECALRWDCRFEANDNDHDQGSVENPELLILITKNSYTITQPQTSHIGTCYLS